MRPRHTFQWLKLNFNFIVRVKSKEIAWCCRVKSRELWGNCNSVWIMFRGVLWCLLAQPSKILLPGMRLGMCEDQEEMDKWTSFQRQCPKSFVARVEHFVYYEWQINRQDCKSRHFSHSGISRSVDYIDVQESLQLAGVFTPATIQSVQIQGSPLSNLNLLSAMNSWTRT